MLNLERDWHNLDTTEVIALLNSSHCGLSQQEAQNRLVQFGPNELVEKKRVSPWAILLGQFKNFLIIILLVAVVLSAVLGEVVDAVLIFVIVLLACVLGFIQEYRAERAMEALKKMAAPLTSVLRDGKETEISARELVPGDIIFLRIGNRIPADARLIETVNLKIDEAPLTGESVPVEKMSQCLEGEVNVGDRKNMVFMGTAVVYGRGKSIVTATGMATEFGKIATMLQEVKEERTPLQINLDKAGKYIAIGALALSFVLAGIGIMRGHQILEMFIWGVALAVAAVPEALPAVVVITLALGVRRMARRHALIRKLPAVETLGCTTFICSDKTGTLTQDQMTLRRIYVDGKLVDVTGVGYEPKGNFHLNDIIIEPTKEPALQMLLRAGSLCNDTSLAHVNGVWKIKGDPTEGALVVAAAKANLWQKDLSSQYPRIGEIPFSSETKRMTTIHKTPMGKVAYSKGAPEIILTSCSQIFRDGREEELTYDDRNKILLVAQEMAAEALRVLGIAYKWLSDNDDVSEKIEQDMVFVGLAGMIDPPREEVKDAIKLCDQAGIKSVMITGDHKLTALAIAKELGLLKEGVGVTGAELDSMTDEEFKAKVEKVEVYARVSPAHKLRVVEALTKKGHVVAMTGDGINDAPALKKADIGIAMGITGTDVSKEASDMVLTDDNFASIVTAVEEGRNIFDNIKKFLIYLLACNIGLVSLMAITLLFHPLIRLPYGAIPLTAIQILFVNLLINGPPAIALSVDPANPDIMRQKPRPRGQGIFTKPMMMLMLITGMWIALISLGVFKWAIDGGRDVIEAQGLCLATTILIQLCNAYNFRSDKQSILRISIFDNKWLNYAVILDVILLLIIVYTPFLQQPFHTVPLNVFDWAIVILLAVTIFPVLEASKTIIRYRERKRLSSVSS